MSNRLWWKKGFESMVVNAVDRHIREHWGRGLMCFWYYMPATDLEWGMIRAVPYKDILTYEDSGWELADQKLIPSNRTREGLTFDLREIASRLPVLPKYRDKDHRAQYLADRAKRLAVQE